MLRTLGLRTLLIGPAVLLIAFMQGGCAVVSPPVAVPPQSVLLAAPDASPLELLPQIDILPTRIPVETSYPAGLIARLNWDDEFGAKTVVFDTPEQTVKLRQAGYGSLMLKFGDAVVHVNPWSAAADYSTLPKADQIWITDSSPEHLDLRAIRQVSKDDTRLIVDAESARNLEGLLSFVPLRSRARVAVGQIVLEAFPTYRAEHLPDGALLRSGNSYLASYGDFRLFLAGDAHFIPQASDVGEVDVALLTLGKVSSLTPTQAAQVAYDVEAKILLPYSYEGAEPAVLGQLLVGSETMVLPLNIVDEIKPQLLTQPPNRNVPMNEFGSETRRSELLALLFSDAREEAPPLLPDLRTLTPSGLSIVRSRGDGTTQLRLTNSVWNGGYGPLDLVGVEDRGSGMHYVVQRIARANGDTDELSVGNFIFHSGHNHWHLDSFAVYEVWSLGRDGMLDEVVATSDKVSYCLRDIRRSAEAEHIERAGFTSCSPVRQGLSVGWTDVYQYYLAGQSIDISGIPDGTYALMSTADPYDLIRESDETNNAVVVYLQIAGTQMEVIDRPAGTLGFDK